MGQHHQHPHHHGRVSASQVTNSRHLFGCLVLYVFSTCRTSTTPGKHYIYSNTPTPHINIQYYSNMYMNYTCPLLLLERNIVARL